ncbi:MAG: DNA alkylation repair protein [Ignavibacteria bacterium]|nr:DNA alkylation repair protein [Ignavibacteria bacterium]
MSSLLKDIYSIEFYSKFSEILLEVIPSFNKEKFIKQIFDENWQSKELKERMKHTSLILNSVFPSDFESTTKLIKKIIIKLRQKQITETSIEFMFLPDYIEKYGINHFDVSVNAIEFVTQFTSCEFAVRPFIIKYGDKMIEQMYEWSLHESHHVRRLSSEGSRPRLPWAMALPTLKKDPRPILPILENLKNDSSEYVRRSVANNLNDIAKDNPEIVIKIAKQWKGFSKETDAVIKHACRTLLKQGHPEILKHFRLTNNQNVRVLNFKIRKEKIAIGDSLEFSFELQNIDKKSQSVRLEYAIHYLRKNGQLSKKVFKISERQLQPNEKIEITRKQSFRIITTRQFYYGQQKLSLIVNGEERVITNFELTA